MLRRRNGQRGLWEALRFGDLEPEKQMDPRLRRIDEVLKDDALVDAVLEAMRGRFPQSGRRGRRGTPAEVALRMLVLKHLKNWSYEQLEWEVKGNLVYRHFCRIDAGKVPDAKTMVRLGQLLEGRSLRAVFERIVQLAVARRVTRGRKMRVDTTVVETPIRYPSDSRLCEDVAQGVCREIERLRSEGVTAPSGFRNVRRSVTRRVREITHVSRRPIARDAKRRALQRPYRRLLTIVRRTIRQADVAVKRARRGCRPLSGRGRRSVRNLERLARVGEKVVTQTKERVFKGNAKSSEKLVSIFETQTKIIRRGKAGRATEFGQMVKVQEAEGGVITDVGVVEGTDHALLVPSVQRHKEVFGHVPHVVATDRGFFKTENVHRIEEMGVRCAAVPKPGYRSPSWLKRERQRSFRKARAWRAGGEARIARLKNTFGMRRARYKGDSGVARSAHWAAIANNLMAIGVAL
ncbi:MAG: ISNCY family transposase [Polyangiaceae bacterium]